MDIQKLQEELRKTRHELLLLYEIGNLIRTTLLLDEVIYLILSAVTSHEGMAFNRAMLFMVDETGTVLDCKMGIGSTRPDVAPIVWKRIQENRITLEGLLDVYHKAHKVIDPELNATIRGIRIPIEKDFGILAKTVIQDKPCIITKEEADHELCDMQLINLNIGQFACVPIRGKDSVIGALLVDNHSTGKEIAETDLQRLMMLANHAGLALENAKTYSEMVITSNQDSLTKLWNHGYFQKLLNESLRDAGKDKKSVGLILLDVDNFKDYNDTFGHQAGDRALEFISKTTKNLVRRYDILARYGGEEFAIVLPDTNRHEASKLAERIREAIEKETSNTWQTTVPRTITVSAGVSLYPEDAEDKEKLIFCADGALYEAKRSGKNKVCVYSKSDNGFSRGSITKPLLLQPEEDKTKKFESA